MQEDINSPSVAQKIEAVRTAVESGAAAQTLLAKPGTAAVKADEKVVQLQATMMADSAKIAAIHQQTMNSLAERNLKENIDGRVELTTKLFRLTEGWLIFIAAIIFFNGMSEFSIGSIRFAWHLPDTVILAVIGATTSTVIGLFLIVTRYFFYIADAASGNNAKVTS